MKRIAWNKGKKMTYKHGMLGKHHSEETKAKMRLHKGKNLGNKFALGLIPWNKGTKTLNYCDDCGKLLKNIYANYCRKCFSAHQNYKQIGLKGLLKQQNMKEPTSIEKKVYDYLVLKKIIFEKQKLINGRFIVDVFIPSLNLIIEADGKYWHSLDRVIKKDKAENAYLQKCGFNMIRLTEQEITSGKFKERLVV